MSTRAGSFFMGVTALALMGARGGCEPPYTGILPADPCGGLTERACLRDDACEPIYAPLDCDCPEVRLCDCAAEPVYDGCRVRQVECLDVLCDVYCEHGFERDANGCETCACRPPRRGCESDADCAPGEACVIEADCACPACFGDGCPPCDCGGQGTCRAMDACPEVITHAADPRTGECVAFATPCEVPRGWEPCAGE